MIADKNRTRLTMQSTSGKNRPSTTRVIARVPSKALLGEHGELIIEHAGREYRLRQTSTGKLILTA
jgi:hemin uptake protein HemP